MNIKNRKFIIIILLSAIFIAYTLFNLFEFSPPDKEGVGGGLAVQTKYQKGSNALSEKNIQVVINVLDKKYETEIKEGDTVYGAMKNIENKKENNFTFAYREYPSLGIFVDEIGGVKGSPGKYWIYYVNDVEASVSVSKYILKNGDIINWKQK